MDEKVIFHNSSIEYILEEFSNSDLESLIKELDEEYLCVSDLLKLKLVKPELSEYIYNRMKEEKIYANDETFIEDIMLLLDEIRKDQRIEFIKALECVRDQIRYEYYFEEAVNEFDDEIYLVACDCKPEFRRLLALQVEANPNVMLNWAMKWPEDRDIMLRKLRYCCGEVVDEYILEEYMERYPEDREYLKEVFEEYGLDIFENEEEDDDES